MFRRATGANSEFSYLSKLSRFSSASFRSSSLSSSSSSNYFQNNNGIESTSNNNIASNVATTNNNTSSSIEKFKTYNSVNNLHCTTPPKTQKLNGRSVSTDIISVNKLINLIIKKKSFNFLNLM